MKTKLSKLLVILTLLIISNTLLHAQLQNANWYFGIQTALNFNDGTLPPTVVTGSLMSTEWSAASVSDDSGNLLFYTNGKSVWNASHQIMANGDNILGNTNISQAVIIVPIPDEPNKYYIFSNAGSEMGLSGVSYSIVDMTLNEGLGDVDATTKNILLLEDSTKRLTAILNPNDNTYWVVVFAKNNDSIEHDTFYTYKVDQTGIVLTNQSVFSFPFSESESTFNYGQMKISPDGQTLALINNTIESDGKDITDAQSIYTFNFDIATGAISSINNTIELNDNLYSYGVEFSPNSDLLYVSSTNKLSDGSAVGRVYQVDYNNMGTTTTLVDGFDPIYGLQIGIDNKIYLANSNGNIDVIDSPDVLGLGANYIVDAIDISGNGGREFPQSIHSIPIATKTVLKTYNTSFANDTITRITATNDGLVVFGQIGVDNIDNLPGEPQSFIAEYAQNGDVLNSDILQIPYSFEVPIEENSYNWEPLPDGMSLNGEINKNYLLSKYDSENNLRYEISTTNINEELIEDETSEQTYLVFPTSSYQDFALTGSSGRTWSKSATQVLSTDGTLYTKALNLARFDLNGVLIAVTELMNYRWYRTETEGTVEVNYPAKITGDNNSLYLTVASRDEGGFTEAAKIYLTNGEFHKKGEWLISYDVRNNTFNKAKLIGQNGSIVPNELIYNQSTLFRKRKNKLFKLDGNLSDIDSLITNKLEVLDSNSDEGTFIILGDNTRTLKKIDSNFEELWSQNLGKKFTIAAASEAPNGEVYYAAIYNEEAKLFDEDGDIIIEHNFGNDVFIARFTPSEEPMMSMKLGKLHGDNFGRRLGYRGNQLEYEESYAVYPNPFNNSIAIRSKLNKYSIEVYDLSGKLILKEPMRSPNKSSSKINTSKFKKGIYTLKIMDERSNIYFKKIFKK